MKRKLIASKDSCDEQTLSELRLEMGKVLSNLDERWISVASRELATHLSRLLADNLSWSPKVVLSWSSFVSGTPDLSPFFILDSRHRTFYLSNETPTGQMRFLRVSPDVGSYRISTEHSSGLTEGAFFDEQCSSSAVILIPGVAFDFQGNRLGNGEGTYRRLLDQKLFSSLPRIGVCWQLQVVPNIPAYPDRVSVDWICHENGILKSAIV